MPTPSLALDHFAYPAHDVAETHRFYTSFLGLPLVAAWSGVSPEWGDRAYVMMVFGLKGGGQIVFFGLEGLAARPQRDGLPKDIRHVAMTASSAKDLDAWKRKLRMHRISYWEEDHDVQKSVYFADPNGLTLEITHPASALAITTERGAKKVVDDWVKGAPARRR